MTMKLGLIDKYLVQLVASVIFSSTDHVQFLFTLLIFFFLWFFSHFFRPSPFKSLQVPFNCLELFFSRFHLHVEKEGKQESQSIQLGNYKWKSTANQYGLRRNKKLSRFCKSGGAIWE